MSVYRFLPLHDCEALRQVQTPQTSGESCVIVGENSLLRSSLLFQSALSVASASGDLVLLVSPHDPRPLYRVTGMTPHSELHLQCIKRTYLPHPADLLRHLCELHTQECLPAAIMIDDIHFYVSHLSQEQSKEAALVKLFAILEDTVAFISQKKGGESCHRMVTAPRGACSKNLLKRYFRELWNVSDSGGQFVLTDDHVPAFRAHLHLNDSNREIVVDKVYRLATENATTNHTS